MIILFLGIIKFGAYYIITGFAPYVSGIETDLIDIMHVVRSISALFAALFLFLLVTPVVVVGITLSLGSLRDPFISFFGKLIGRSTLRLAGVHMTVQHSQGAYHGPAIYIINHSSTLDLLVMIGLGLPRIRFLAKHELQYNPLFFILGRLTGQIFINRTDSEKAIARIHKAYGRIRENKLSILVAPEGSRKHPGVIGPFKKGAFRMALDLGYPIVPIYVDGASQLSSGGSLITRPGKIKVTIYPPVDTAGWTTDRLDEPIEAIRKQYMEWSHPAVRDH